MKILSIACSFLVFSKLAYAQTGFFLVVEDKNLCKMYAVALDGSQKYCITDEALIRTSDFKVEGDLKYSELTQGTQYFNLHFTENGYSTLKLLCEHMPEKKLILVVKGKVAGTYDNKKLKPAQIMPIAGKADSKEIKWVFENLKNPD